MNTQENLDSDLPDPAALLSEVQIRQIRAAVSSPWMRQTLRWLEAIKDATRFKLVYTLHRYGPLCVSDLASILGVSSSAVSQHLRKLKDKELVAASRRKQTLFYVLDDPDFVNFIQKLSLGDGAGIEGSRPAALVEPLPPWARFTGLLPTAFLSGGLGPDDSSGGGAGPQAIDEAEPPAPWARFTGALPAMQLRLMTNHGPTFEEDC